MCCVETDTGSLGQLGKSNGLAFACLTFSANIQRCVLSPSISLSSHTGYRAPERRKKPLKEGYGKLTKPFYAIVVHSHAHTNVRTHATAHALESENLAQTALRCHGTRVRNQHEIDSQWMSIPTWRIASPEPAAF